MTKRYIRKGKCNRCGWCCLIEPTPCPYLKGTKEGEYSCSEWGTKKRDIEYPYCKPFPPLPPIKNPKCGYYFIDTWENNKIVKGAC